VAIARKRTEPDVVRITNAPTSAQDELAARRRRYTVSMTIRTLCFVGAIAFEGWLRWVMLAGAFVLPYIAVVMANTANPRIEGSDLRTADGAYKELG
jgi:hypothetical protein